jgi:hypothetical protein
MKLTKTGEWTLLAVLAAYIAFMPRIGPIRDFLSTGLGRLVALLLIVYTWKYVSALVAVLLVVAFVRCTTSVWEGLEMRDDTESTEPPEVQGKAKAEGTDCPSGTTFDVGTQMCKSDAGAMVLPIRVACGAGYRPNAAGSRCVKIATPPSPPPPSAAAPELPASSTGSKAGDSAGSATSTEGFQGRGTIATTPGEAQTKAKSTVVLQQQGGIESFGNWGPGYPLR